MDQFLEAVKLSGAIFGIVSVGFIVYDRLVRRRPIFALDIEGHIAGENSVCLRAVSLLEEAILIQNLSVEPDLVGIAAGSDVHSIVSALGGLIHPVVLSPKGEYRWLVLIKDASSPRKHDKIVIAAEWRDTRNPWPWRRKVKIRTSLAEMEILKAAKYA